MRAGSTSASSTDAGDRRALEDPEHLGQPVEPRRAAADALPRGQEPGQRLGVDRLDLATQRGERAPPQLAQHVVVAPLALDAVGPELAPHDATVDLEALERLADPGLVGAEAGGGLVGEERSVGAGEAGDEVDAAGRRPGR